MRNRHLLGCQRKSGLWQAINVLLLSDELLEGFGGILRMQRENRAGLSLLQCLMGTVWSSSTEHDQDTEMVHIQHQLA